MILVMLMIMSPGANQILVLQSGMVLGHKAAIFNVAGITSSMLIHGAITGMGIALVIVKSPSLYQLIKMLGVGYIAYLAISSIYSAYQLRNKQRDSGYQSEKTGEIVSETNIKSFSKGFTSNILNVQTLIVFLSIFPQFMNPEHGLLIQSLFLTLIFIGLLIGWYAVLIALIFKIRRYLIQPIIQFRIKAITGSLLLFMAVKMLLK
jgi:homoserine/homoserine lactone efflux protein